MDDEVEDTEKKNLEPFKTKSEANDPENNYDDNLTVHGNSCEVTNTFEVKDLVMEAPLKKEKTDNENNSLSVALKASRKTLEES